MVPDAGLYANIPGTEAVSLNWVLERAVPYVMALGLLHVIRVLPTIICQSVCPITNINELDAVRCLLEWYRHVITIQVQRRKFDSVTEIRLTLQLKNISIKSLNI